MGVMKTTWDHLFFRIHHFTQNSFLTKKIVRICDLFHDQSQVRLSDILAMKSYNPEFIAINGYLKRTSGKLQKLQQSEITSKYIGVFQSIIKGATVTRIYSPHFLHFSLSFPTKFSCLPTLPVPSGITLSFCSK